MKNESRPILTSRHLTSPILLRRRKSAIVLRNSSHMSKRPRGSSNAKNMDTTVKPVEDNRHMQNVLKMTWTTCRKIARSNLDEQTANKIIQLTQDLVMFTKKKGNTWGETQEECVLPGSKETFWDLHGRKQPRLWGQIQPMKTTDMEHSWRN